MQIFFQYGFVEIRFDKSEELFKMWIKEGN